MWLSIYLFCLRRHVVLLWDILTFLVCHLMKYGLLLPRYRARGCPCHVQGPSVALLNSFPEKQSTARTLLLLCTLSFFQPCLHAGAFSDWGRKSGAFSSFFTKDIDPFTLLFLQTFPKTTQPGHLSHTKPHPFLSLQPSSVLLASSLPIYTSWKAGL